MNSNGPMTDPCGTPDETGSELEEAPFTHTYCTLEVR